MPHHRCNAPPTPSRRKQLSNLGWRSRAVGLHGGTFGMHTRHVKTPPPAHASAKAAKSPYPEPALPCVPDNGPPAVDVMDTLTSTDVNTIFTRGHRKTLMSKSRSPSAFSFAQEGAQEHFGDEGRHFHRGHLLLPILAGSARPPAFLSAQTFLGEDNMPRTRDKPLRNEGVHGC